MDHSYRSRPSPGDAHLFSWSHRKTKSPNHEISNSHTSDETELSFSPPSVNWGEPQVHNPPWSCKDAQGSEVLSIVKFSASPALMSGKGTSGILEQSQNRTL